MDASTILDFLQTTAGTAATTSASQGFDPFSLISGYYDTVEIRTNAAPPVKLAVRDLGGQPSPYTQALQPTLIFSGSAGRYVYAPYGEAGEYTGTVASVGALAALAIGGFIVGKLWK